jgi:hypothetical protein
MQQKSRYILLEITMKMKTQLQHYNECLILELIKTLFRYHAVSTTVLYTVGGRGQLRLPRENYIYNF